MAEVRLARLDPHAADRVVTVLNAGATIHAVAHDEQRDRYLVRAELFEFLSLVAKRAFETSKQHVTMAELEKIVTVALLPDVREAVEAVLQHLHPINETDGFTSELLMAEVEHDNPRVARPVRNVLNAGATLRVVQRDREQPGRYLVHGDLYKALARIRARSFAHGAGAAIAAGPLLEASGEKGAAPILPSRERRQITHQASGGPTADPDDERLRARYRDQLLSAIGLGAQLVDARLASTEAEQAAFAAWANLKHHAERNPKLGEYLRRRQDELGQELRQAFDQLRARIGADEHRAELLAEADTDVQRILPVLMLFPEIGLVAAMIEALERAAQHEGGQREHEQDLLDRLREVRHAQGELTSPEAWIQVGKHLGQPGDRASLQSRLRAVGGKHLN